VEQTPPKPPPKPPSKLAIVLVLSIFFVGGPLLLAGGVYAWTDEQSGVAGKAHVTRCTKAGSGKGSSVHCDATWIYNDKPANGWVQNAKYNYAGKTIDVRIHGTDHVTVATYWVPIGLLIMGLFVTVMGFVLLRGLRRNRPRPA